MPADISATVGKLDEDADLMHVSTLFEEQNSIETLLSEIRELENTQSGQLLDIASLVNLRIVNGLELRGDYQIGRAPAQQQLADQEEENISFNIDLRSKPVVEVLTLF